MSALIGGKFIFQKKYFTRFALQSECCNFKQWEAFEATDHATFKLRYNQIYWLKTTHMSYGTVFIMHLSFWIFGPRGPTYLTWTIVDISLTTYLPHLVHVVFEWPLMFSLYFLSFVGKNHVFTLQSGSKTHANTKMVWRFFFF